MGKTAVISMHDMDGIADMDSTGVSGIVARAMLSSAYQEVGKFWQSELEKCNCWVDELKLILAMEQLHLGSEISLFAAALRQDEFAVREAMIDASESKLKQIPDAVAAFMTHRRERAQKGAQ